ncbi:ABC transporter substrate-binding protein [Gemmatimonas sp.]|uniref:ABC transporter substrate-binding protein n=1 Tax=Gemmatimonas sp. TaxID=1962908 RepID=UPI0035665E9F
MKKNFYRFVAVAALLGVAACGSDSDDSASTETTASETNSTGPASDEAPTTTEEPPATTPAEPIRVGITQFATIPPLDGLREAFIERMNEEYGEDGWEFDYLPAEGVVGNTAPIAQQLSSGDYDIFLGIATASTQALANEVDDRPIIFGAVADPVGAGIRDDDSGDDGNVTGVSSLGPIADQMKLIIDSSPDIRTFGFIYNDAEQNAIFQADVAEAALAELGDFEVVRTTAASTAEVAAAAQQLASQVDVIWFPASSTALEGLPALVQVSESTGVPLFCADTTAVKPANPEDGAPGCLGTVGFSFPRSGTIAAELAIQVLNGAAPGSIPTVYVPADATVLNLCAAKAQGFVFPQSVINAATEVIDCQ